MQLNLCKPPTTTTCIMRYYCLSLDMIHRKHQKVSALIYYQYISRVCCSSEDAIIAKERECQGVGSNYGYVVPPMMLHFFVSGYAEYSVPGSVPGSAF
mmetsp:Transcript_1771/g.2876  ORF Transcript_1771/g.2876 Transcript_1771/m.2876 type:complete len:98 (-) Transcript_1771:23-316(-)